MQENKALIPFNSSLYLPLTYVYSQNNNYLCHFSLVDSDSRQSCLIFETQKSTKSPSTKEILFAYGNWGNSKFNSKIMLIITSHGDNEKLCLIIKITTIKNYVVCHPFLCAAY